MESEKKKVKSGILVRVNGMMEVVYYSSVEELQELVGGGLYDTVRFRARMVPRGQCYRETMKLQRVDCAFVNDEFLLNGMMPNVKASEITGHLLRGPVVLVNSGDI